ncbi:hypothetical protein [Hyphococcus sp.]|uniref:hypothetical protein n=1 Tax=Hyphococcus sp. TaxID=2038636 RepID=UPI002082AF6D|nr:MAG: hypothetical protein DHS20C04_10650 [Marinicaulis sp.]
MIKLDSRFILAGFSALAFSAHAQEAAVEQEPLGAPTEASAEATLAEEPDGTFEVNPDEMADSLNSAQQLQQSFTLKRTIDGELVETTKRTVTFSRDQPYRETEAGKTTLERIKTSFDGEALTRTEAFEEAKIDFVIADLNRDQQINAAEFATLVDSWRNNKARQADAPSQEIARQRQYDLFLEELDPDVAKMQNEAYAKEKFSFMAGAAETMSLQDYIREYMLDFDSMDANKDMVLNGDELMRFRALNRGETLDM